MRTVLKQDGTMDLSEDVSRQTPADRCNVGLFYVVQHDHNPVPPKIAIFSFLRFHTHSIRLLIFYLSALQVIPYPVTQLLIGKIIA